MNVVYPRLAAAPKLVSVALGAAASAQACAEYQPSLLKGDLVADASGGSGSAGAMGSPPIAGSGGGDGAGDNGGGGASASGGRSGGTDTCSPSRPSRRWRRYHQRRGARST